ncbi:hypothetical protein ACWDZ4_09820 [Streptomyces sp. NPDC003016]
MTAQVTFRIADEEHFRLRMKEGGVGPAETARRLQRGRPRVPEGVRGPGPAPCVSLG